MVMRSAGCIVNDFIDIDIDRKVSRTQNRALFCVLLTFLSMSISIKSFTMHPADLITIEPIKKIINKIKILLDEPFVEDAKMKLIG